MSTPNALETICFGAKDTLIVIDDFAPTGSTVDVQRCHANADRIVRAQGNHSGRERLNQDGTARPAKVPRGLILATGEDVPMGASLRARLHVSEVGPRDVNVQLLSECQQAAAQGLYANAMSGYLRWVACHYEHIQQSIAAEIATLRHKATMGQMHRRTPNTVANLAIGLQNFLQFAGEYGLSTEETSALWDEGWTSLTAAANAQYQHQKASDPVQRFFELLRGAIASGKAHLASSEGNVPTNKENGGSDPARFGWRFVTMGENMDWRPQALDG
jgi:hypothetical protein